MLRDAQKMYAQTMNIFLFKAENTVTSAFNKKLFKYEAIRKYPITLRDMRQHPVCEQD